MTKVVVRVGSIFVADQTAIAEQRRVNQIGFGYGARSFSGMCYYKAGEVAELQESEARRLMAAGVVEIVPP